MNKNVKYFGKKVEGLNNQINFESTNPLQGYAPYNILLSNNTINENEPLSTLIGEFSSLDPDAGDTHIYSLVSPGVDNANFVISSSSLISGIIFDYEIQTSHSIFIRSTDSHGKYYEKEFTILIGDLKSRYVNENYISDGYVEYIEL